MEYATGRAFGVDTVWFGEAVRAIQPTLPGRPSPPTTLSVLVLSVAVATNWMDRRWTRTVWVVCLLAASAMPFVTILAYLFDAIARLETAVTTGMAITTALGLLLLVAAVVVLQPAWLLAHSDRLSLIRLGWILAGFPLLVGLSRRAFLALGLGSDVALTYSVAAGTAVLGQAAYRRSRREHKLNESVESDRNLLRVSSESLLDPQARLEATRDSSGQIVDFLYRDVNQATCDYLGLTREELIGLGVVEAMPGIRYTLLPDYVRCLDTGEPLILNDFSYDNEILADTRRYDLRCTRATPTALVLTWRDVTDRVHTMERLAASEQQLRQKSDLMKSELDSAATYMASIMPTGLQGAVQVSSRYLPSRQLGGDCLDYYWIDDDHLLIKLIDVSGHGLEPALLAVSVHNLMRSGSLTPETVLSPEAVLTKLNRLFAMDQHNDHYFTMWYGIYEASTRTLRYASAGAPPALAFNSATGTAVALTALSTPVPPVGLFEDTEFTSDTFQVPPGCRMLVYSDGASEITLADGQQLTGEAFEDLASRVAASSDWSLDDLIDELRALTPSGAFEDDFSLIQLKFD
ncbi:MAG: PP2C family protein-serine/threonine phosphatase [Candidatus Nanopelagicales bacterium]